MAARKTRSRKTPSRKTRSKAGKRRTVSSRAKPATRRAKPKRRAQGRTKTIAADRSRLGLHRGEDMTLAARDLEVRADRQRSRDDVHERDISGT
jgi:hypothetical protein